jgi:membrane protease subunit HflK
MAWGDKDNQGPWGRPPGGGNSGNNGSGPFGGGGSNGPDIDAMIRRSQEKLKQMFPGNGGRNGKGIGLIVGIIVVLWLSSGIYFVKEGERGVVKRFGNYSRTTDVGLNYRLPFPIETVRTVSVTAVNRVEVGYRSGSAARTKNTDGSVAEESLMLTGDENIVNITFEVQWKISDAPKFLFNIRNPEDTVKAVAESVMREVVGKTPITPILAEGKSELANNARMLMQQVLDDYQSGVVIDGVNLKEANPPSQVIDAFLDVQSARADMETSRNQAEAYRNDIIPRARGQAQQMILEAEGYKQEVVARAQGEASRFSAVYNEYKVAKDVTKKRMYLETMEGILGGMNKIIVESRGGSQGVLPYLPLGELKPAKPTEEAKP